MFVENKWPRIKSTLCIMMMIKLLDSRCVVGWNCHQSSQSCRCQGNNDNRLSEPPTTTKTTKRVSHSCRHQVNDATTKQFIIIMAIILIAVGLPHRINIIAGIDVDAIVTSVQCYRPTLLPSMAILCIFSSAVSTRWSFIARTKNGGNDRKRMSKQTLDEN